MKNVQVDYIKIGPMSNNVKRHPSKVCNQVLNSPARQTVKAVNCMLRYLRNYWCEDRNF